MDFTDQFDKRLETMHKATNCSASEIDVAVAIFERLKTSQAICATLMEDSPDQARAVLAIFSELCAEARSGHGARTDE